MRGAPICSFSSPVIKSTTPGVRADFDDTFDVDCDCDCDCEWDCDCDSKYSALDLTGDGELVYIPAFCSLNAVPVTFVDRG
jgi:hypothetical protein